MRSATVNQRSATPMPKLSKATSEELDADEHAIDASGLRDPLVTRVSITIAILAVIGVTMGSLESVETAATFTANSGALLHQDKATDTWNAFEAKNIKTMLQTLAPPSTDSTQRPATLDRNPNRDAAALAADAREQESLSEAKLGEAEVHARRHHILTLAVTLVQVAIALATLSIIARRQRWPWYGAMALGLAGVLMGAYAYL